MDELDVLVIGGGPAGAAAAITLARAGSRCAVLEKQTTPGWKIGETLPPESRALLQSLGVWEAFEKDGHLSSPGNCSAWGSDQLAFKDFIFNPHGCAWQLDRPRFETTLLNAAESAGAHVCRGIASLAISLQPTGWEIKTEKKSYRARWLVDASGRGALVARHCAVERTVLDKLVAIYALAVSPARADADARTYLEARPDGWWYSTLMPDHRRIVVFLTDADLLPGQEWRAPDWFPQRLGETLFIREWVESHGYRFDDPPKLTSAHSGRLEHCHGPGWAAVGDAAQSFDPLSGEGLFHALLTGRDAAQGLLQKISGSDDASLLAYSSLQESLWRRFVRNRHAFYLAESRWPAEPFWQRRHAEPG